MDLHLHSHIRLHGVKYRSTLNFASTHSRACCYGNVAPERHAVRCVVPSTQHGASRYYSIKLRHFGSHGRSDQTLQLNEIMKKTYDFIIYAMWPRHSSGFPPQNPRFDVRSGHVGFVVDKATLECVFSEYFGFPCQFSFHQMLQTHLSSGAGTTGQLVTGIPNGLSHPAPRKNNMRCRVDGLLTSDLLLSSAY
jgi:hypothetical protein